MTWHALEPARGRAAAAAVALSSFLGRGRVAAAMTLTLRRGQLDNHAMIAEGARVRVLLGRGEHAGMLRIEPGEGFVLSRPGGKRPALDLVCIRLPLPPGVLAAKRQPMPCEYDFGADWIEVTLPAWACPTPAPLISVPAPAAVAAIDQPPKATGNATPPARGAQLAAQAAEMARRRAGA